MKTQKHNMGELEKLEVEIEKKLVQDLQIMSKNAELSVDDLVAIAIKRFKSSHADYMGIDLDYP